MNLSDFDFELPEALIALRPMRPRRASRMLVSAGGQITDQSFTDLPSWLSPKDLLVFNDTRVVPARLNGIRHRETKDGSGAAKFEAMLISRESADTWIAMARPAKKLSTGDRVAFETLTATVMDRVGPDTTLKFDASGPDLDAAIALVGEVPLPPYIAQRRPTDDDDTEDYQTVFAKRPGAVAAPTASLHFDDTLLGQIAAKGVKSVAVTLHVGAGTFLPVRADDVSNHHMHAEWGEVTPQAADMMNAARAAGGRLIAAGTTALRLLESAVGADGQVQPFQGKTDIFIRPGHRFLATDGLITNFHLPRSTLFMLVSALMGTTQMRDVYAHAIRERYRFYSYGDGSLLLPGQS